MSEDGATDVAADGDGAESVTPTRSSLRRRLQGMDSERFEHHVADV